MCQRCLQITQIQTVLSIFQNVVWTTQAGVFFLLDIEDGFLTLSQLLIFTCKAKLHRFFWRIQIWTVPNNVQKPADPIPVYIKRSFFKQYLLFQINWMWINLVNYIWLIIWHVSDEVIILTKCMLQNNEIISSCGLLETSSNWKL